MVGCRSHASIYIYISQAPSLCLQMLTTKVKERQKNLLKIHEQRQLSRDPRSQQLFSAKSFCVSRKHKGSDNVLLIGPFHGRVNPCDGKAKVAPPAQSQPAIWKRSGTICLLSLQSCHVAWWGSESESQALVSSLSNSWKRFKDGKLL